MIIMAQHPHAQHQQQHQRTKTGQISIKQQQPLAATETEQQFHIPITKQQQQQQHNKMQITTTSEPNQIISDDNKQQQQQQDDNKRSLIKNQLCLIEQLQLENADLRNERDQLQLENEELKFQLQMISSSNILSQPGSTFNNQTLVGNGESGPKSTHQQRQQQPKQQIDAGHLAARKTMATDVATSTTSNEVTVSRGISNARKNPSVNRLIVGQQVQQHSNNFLVRSSKNPAIVDEELSTDDVLRGAADTIGASSIRQPPPLTVSGKSLGCKSTSLTAINVKSVSASLASRCSQKHRDGDDDDDDDEERRRKFVEQIYGDSEKIRAAAIVIQRAFRKYQICKRFRTITEQLRQARQPATQGERKSEPSSPNASTRGRSADGFTFASGATRAAAWESLSYAASRLAAAAASATAVRQGESENAQPKQSTNQPTQPPLAPNNQKTHRNQRQRQPLAESRSNSMMKSADPVMAAAINFQQLESMRKRQYRVGLNIFNKSPEKGISFLIAHSFIDASPSFTKNSSSYYHSNQLHFIDKQHVLHERTVASMRDSAACQLCMEEENLRRNIAHFLLHRKGLAKEKIGQYLGNLQENFNQDVLRYYLQELDFNGLQIDLALRKFLTTFRLPGEAQKIERIVDCFAQRYVQCQQVQLNPLISKTISSSKTTKHHHQQPIIIQSKQLITVTTNHPSEQQQQQQQQRQSANTPEYKNNLMILSKDEIFILTFAIIMLNTDLHSPSLKPTSRMSPQQFVNNLRGVFKSHTIQESDLIEIYDRVKANQITTTPDHVSHVLKVQQGLTVNNFQKKELPNLCVPHRRLVCFCRLFEVYDVTKKERVGQHQREIFLFNDLLLVTKLVRRVRANSSQAYTYRQSISLQGLYVQLFQSQHYSFGIKLCRKSDDETLIMFNARNELDQSRFVDDLSESIAEMDEMETIKAHNLIETIHFRQQERLRRHRMSHATSETVENKQPRPNKVTHMIEKCDTTTTTITTVAKKPNSQVVLPAQAREDTPPDDNLPSSPSSRQKSDEVTIPKRAATEQREPVRRISEFRSMLNLSSSGDDENRTQPKGLRMNHSFVQHPHNQPPHQPGGSSDRQPGSHHNDSGSSSGQRRCSTGSVHSLDSGLFLSRDISPNQSG